jgi:hypothetical protein
MRRLDLVPASVLCPHFKRQVIATLNRAIDRLVACDEANACRDPQPADPLRPFPQGCPVFPSQAK